MYYHLPFVALCVGALTACTGTSDVLVLSKVFENPHVIFPILSIITTLWMVLVTILEPGKKVGEDDAEKCYDTGLYLYMGAGGLMALSVLDLFIMRTLPWLVQAFGWILLGLMTVLLYLFLGDRNPDDEWSRKLGYVVTISLGVATMVANGIWMYILW